MLGPPLLSSPFRMMVRDGLCRSDSDVEFARVRSCLIDCWWAIVRARRSELRWMDRSSAEGGSPKMKNFMKQKINSAMEAWPSRKPCVKERLRYVSGVRGACERPYEEPTAATGSGDGAASCSAMVVCVICYHRMIKESSRLSLVLSTLQQST